jgi:hypothetical protein
MLILLILIISAAIFLLLGYRMKSWQVIGYAFASILTLSVLLFIQDNPNVKVTTPYVTLERKLDALSTKQQENAVTQKQLQEKMITLTKLIRVIEGGVGILGDDKSQRDRLVRKYLKELDSQISEEELKDFNRDLETLSPRRAK